MRKTRLKAELQTTGGNAMRRWWPALAVAVSFWPVWRWYFLRMIDGSDEKWGVVALAAALVLLARRPAAVGRAAVPLWTVSALVAVYAATYQVLTPLPRAIIAVAAVAALAASRYGRDITSGTLGLLVLALPVISSLQYYLGYPLRLVVAQLSAQVLHLGGLSVSVQGLCLVSRGEMVVVDAPCSGVRMLWTGMFLTMALCSAHRLNKTGTVVAGSLGIVVIILGNALRSALLFLKESGSVALPDWTHSVIGVVLFALSSSLIIVLTGRVRRIGSCALS